MSTIENPSITTNDLFAGFGGQVEEIDTRLVGVPDSVIRACDNAVAHFAVRENKKQLSIVMPSEEAAELLAEQIHQYCLARGVSCSTLEHDGPVVRFRFAKPRQNGDSDV